MKIQTSDCPKTENHINDVRLVIIIIIIITITISIIIFINIITHV